MQEPQGIPFFNIKSGETHYCKLEPTIQAYINSSDMGINASRDQDFGWRLGKDWVKAVKAFRRNEQKMQFLISRNSGQKVTTTQILYAIYGEQVRAFEQVQEDEAAPFEEEYLKAIAEKPEVAPEPNADDVIQDNFDEVHGDDDEELPEPAPEPEAPKPSKPSKTAATVNKK